MVAHALAVLLVWMAVFKFDVDLVSARLWLAVAWLWVLWPLAFLLGPARFRLKLLAPFAVAIALLLPCVGTIHTFTVWAVSGFAP